MDFYRKTYKNYKIFVKMHTNFPKTRCKMKNFL